MPDNYLRLYVHFTWKTWDRLPLLVPDVAAVVYPVLLSKAKEQGCRTLAIGGVEYHVHVLLQLAATVPIADLMKEMKGASSRHAHLTLPDRFFKWQGTYGAVTVSPSALPDVTRYVENQVEHHQRNYLDVELETVEMSDD